MTEYRKVGIGDRVDYAEDSCRVEGTTAAGDVVCLRLRGSDGALHVVDAAVIASEVILADADAGGGAAQQQCEVISLEGLPEDVKEEALEWRAHLLEVATGYRSGHAEEALPDEPREGYTPEASIEPRINAKAAELGISVRHLWKKWSAWQEGGVYALVDQRKARLSHPLAHVDERLIDAIRAQAVEETDDSTGTLERLRRRVTARLDNDYGEGVVAVPGKRTFNKYVRQVLHGLHTTGQATTRRSTATQPDRPFATQALSRPGEQVQIDSTPLDVRAWDPATDETYAVELTYAMDVYTRSVAAWRMTPVGTKSVDAALLLGDMLVPEPMRPGWPGAVKFQALSVPYERLVSLDERLELAAARPMILPEAIVIDHGKVFTSLEFRDACEQLGISLQLARKAQPTDKAHVERGFGTFRTQFSEHVAGYKANNVVNRGKDPDARAMWTISELEEFFAEYITVVYQRSRHSGLRLPGNPDALLSPNEAYAEAITRTGYLHLPPDPHMYFKLLKTAWAVIRNDGVKVKTLRYDGAVLHKYRNTASAYEHKGGKWPFKYDPRDRNHIYWQDPEDHAWHPLRWVHATDEHRPFTDRTLEYVKGLLAQRNARQVTEAEVAAALEDLQNRTDTPASLIPRERRRAIRDSERGRAAQRDRERADLSLASTAETPQPLDEDDLTFDPGEFEPLQLVFEDPEAYNL